MAMRLNKERRHGAVLAAGLLLAPLGTAWAADAQPAQADPLVAPSPPGQPTMRTLNTKTTTRLWGADPYAQAVAVTQHLWTAARPQNAPGENDNVPDRPWGLVLVTADDPLTAISAVPLVHFPNDAPILFVTKTGIPQITLDEIKRLGPTGISRNNNLDVMVVGEAANSAVLRELDALKLKHEEITAPDVYQLADKIDRYYGRVANPDTGVPTMGGTASSGGNGMMNVMVGSTEAWQYMLPATHWASHMATGLFWVDHDKVPEATVNALKRRNGMAHIYVFGGPEQVSAAVVKQLSQYGSVSRIDNDDPIAFNKPPKNNLVSSSVAFAKMWDPSGMVGWNITGPGHGFTLVNVSDWQAAVASAPLSHIGFHAPLLLTDDAGTLPKALEGYFKMVGPTYLNTPAQGPYNMTYVLGTFDQVSWQQQARIDFVSEMSNRRVWNQETGSMYNAGQP
ncbi:cell wall-binding repeat-containing protein [Methylobacterium fujisawaense]|jgi:hypothetical protein|uniref:cell wall-binding repeat-containing protein n=1 Tax=Methylobacterium fujisawaense TaxID=107400 RepID=UPI00313AC79F